MNTQTENLLRDLVLERGIVDIIMGYKKDLENSLEYKLEQCGLKEEYFDIVIKDIEDFINYHMINKSNIINIEIKSENNYMCNNSNGGSWSGSWYKTRIDYIDSKNKKQWKKFWTDILNKN